MMIFADSIKEINALEKEQCFKFVKLLRINRKIFGKKYACFETIEMFDIVYDESIL